MNRHPECTCSWSPCHHSNYGVQDALEADNKRLKAENERLEREAKNDLIAYKAAIERQNELRAELAGLKTGYQAYERVNAELKAEVEKLRKDAERYRWLRANNYYAHVQVMEADGSMPYLYAEELDFSIDAAMAQGDQP